LPGGLVCALQDVQNPLSEVSVVVVLLFLGFSALRTSLGLVGESLFLIESLLAFCEYESNAAVFAS
jgi:hypothetical protein